MHLEFTTLRSDQPDEVLLPSESAKIEFKNMDHIDREQLFVTFSDANGVDWKYKLTSHRLCLVALGIHWVRSRGAQGRDAPSTIPPLGYLVVVGVDSPGSYYYAFYFGVGALCVTWVACVLFLVEEASEPESPAGTGDRME